MKKIVMTTKLFVLGVACLFNANESVAQGCMTQGNLVVSTGIDPTTQGVLPSGVADPMWTLIQSPPAPGGWNVTIGGPAFVIPTSNAWHSIPGSRYINAFNTNESVLENWTTGVEYVYERPFCICNANGSNDPISVTFDLKLHSDNWAEVFFVDGNTNVSTSLLVQNFTLQVPDNFRNPTDDMNVTLMIPPGSHTLEIHHRNSGVDMGISLWGTLSSPGVLSDNICSPSGSISGNKYEDIDGNGIVSGSDVVVPGWDIELYNSSNTLVATTTTDGGGFYNFPNLAPGAYTVTEVPQAGWIMVNPASGSQNINVTVNSASIVNFLNKKEPIIVVPLDPCDVRINIESGIEDCGVTLNTSISNIPAGYMIISSTWNFGDGYSSNLLSPSHYYGDAGIYEACLKVIVFDGDECCTVEKCFTIEIDKACEGGCDMEAEIEINELDGCEFQFFGNILFTGTPITNWVWNFGDGTTGVGPNITHTYAAQGTYNVALIIFGSSEEGEECCFTKVRTEVDVSCNPNSGSNSKTIENGSDLNSEGINNVILYPNPSNGTVNISFELVNDDQVSIMIIDASGKKVYNGTPINKSSGANEIKLTTDLPKGVYTGIISTKFSKTYKKLIIL